MNHVYDNELKNYMLFQILLRDNLMSHLASRGQKMFLSQFNGRQNVWYKKFWLANVTTWQKKNITPNFLPICDVHGMERPKNASAKCHVMAH